MSVVKTLNNKLRHDQNLMVIILLCLITGLGAALRIYDLGAESYWVDEVLMIQYAEMDVEQLIYQRVGPLYKILAHFWQQSFGTSEVATRSLSALAGVAAIPAIYMVGRDLFGRKVGLISALILAISGLQIFHSQNYRYYSLFVLMTLLSYFFYIRSLKTKKASHFRLYVAASILLYYAHNMGIFVLIAMGLYFIFQWKRYRDLRGRWILSQAAILLGLTPGLLYISWIGYSAQNAGSLESGFTPLAHLKSPPIWLPIYTLGEFLFFHLDWAIIIGALVFFLGGMLLFVTWRGKTRWLASVQGLGTDLSEFSDRRTEFLLLGLWVLCPIAMPFILSQIVGPMYTARYTVSASPALYLLLAVGMIALGNVVPEFISVGVLVIVMVFGLHYYYVTDIKTQWREAATYVVENGRPGDVLVFETNIDAIGAFNWYYYGTLPECPIVKTSENEGIIADLARCTTRYERIWLVTYGSWPGRLAVYFFNPDLETTKLIKEQHFVGTSVYLFSPSREAVFSDTSLKKGD